MLITHFLQVLSFIILNIILVSGGGKLKGAKRFLKQKYMRANCLFFYFLILLLNVCYSCIFCIVFSIYFPSNLLSWKYWPSIFSACVRNIINNTWNFNHLKCPIVKRPQIALIPGMHTQGRPINIQNSFAFLHRKQKVTCYSSSLNLQPFACFVLLSSVVVDAPRLKSRIGKEMFGKTIFENLSWLEINWGQILKNVPHRSNTSNSIDQRFIIEQRSIMEHQRHLPEEVAHLIFPR